MVCRRRRAVAEALEEQLLLVVAEIVVDPGLRAAASPPRAPARGEQRLGVEDPALPGPRLRVGKEGEPILDRHGGVERLLGPRLQRADAGPVRHRGAGSRHRRRRRAVVALQQLAPADIGPQLRHPGQPAGGPPSANRPSSAASSSCAETLAARPTSAARAIPGRRARAAPRRHGHQRRPPCRRPQERSFHTQYSYAQPAPCALPGHRLSAPSAAVMTTLY